MPKDIQLACRISDEKLQNVAEKCVKRNNMVHVELQSVHKEIKEMLILNVVKFNYVLYNVLYIYLFNMILNYC